MIQEYDFIIRLYRLIIEIMEIASSFGKERGFTTQHGLYQ
jgi:hypothetical protein